MIRPVRILEVINDATVGGGQQHVLSLAEGLDKTIFEVSVACTENGPLVDDLRSRGIMVHPVDMKNAAIHPPLFQLSQLLRRNQIEIMHAHGGVAGFWGRLSAALARTPVRFCTLHGIHYLHYSNAVKRGLFITLERLLARMTDRIICVAESDRQTGLRKRLFSQDQCTVIRNGIDVPVAETPGKTEQLRKALGIAVDAPIIGTVGRLHRQKGQWILIQAAREIIRVIPNAKVLLVGDGPLRKQLERQSNSLGLDRSILFLGARRDAIDVIRVFDVFVLPSLWEGLPYSLLEALALERPVVASAVDGIPEVAVHGESGFLVSPGNPRELAQAVIQLLTNKAYAETLGRKGREVVLEGYCLDRMVRETSELYLSSLSTCSRG
jgi:glycosyltransferase involved in cell wall biosynthesis